MKKVSLVILVVACLAMSMASASAQDYRARVQGSVVDSSQGVLPGVTVTLVNEATNVAVVRPSAFCAVTRTRRVFPWSTCLRTYVLSPAPLISEQLPPSASQRRHA